MKKWEYKSISIKRINDMSECNELGIDGWEMVNIVLNPTALGGFRAIFKRELIK